MSIQFINLGCVGSVAWMAFTSLLMSEFKDYVKTRVGETLVRKYCKYYKIVNNFAHIPNFDICNYAWPF
jgi:hypothetical protein